MKVLCEQPRIHSSFLHHQEQVAYLDAHRLSDDQGKDLDRALSKTSDRSSAPSSIQRSFDVIILHYSAICSCSYVSTSVARRIIFRAFGFHREHDFDVRSSLLRQSRRSTRGTVDELSRFFARPRSVATPMFFDRKENRDLFSFHASDHGHYSHDQLLRRTYEQHRQ